MSDFNTYQREACKTFKPKKPLDPDKIQLLDWALGIGGESGEVLDIIKHSIFHEEGEIDKMQLAKELGDILWYVSAMATSTNMSLADIFALNRAKLNHRYISGAFSFEESANRHAQENKFSDTAIYKCLQARICGEEDVPYSIIVIGPDGAGKTTMTEKMSEMMHRRRVKCDYRQKNKPELAKHYLFTNENVIYDRFYFPDELVYSEVKKLDMTPTYQESMHDLIPLMVAANIIIVYTDVPMNILRERSAGWADDYVSVDDLADIKKTYQKYLFELSCAGVPVIESDVCVHDMESAEWLKGIKELIEECQIRAKLFAWPHI